MQKEIPIFNAGIFVINKILNDHRYENMQIHYPAAISWKICTGNIIFKPHFRMYKEQSLTPVLVLIAF